MRQFGDSNVVFVHIPKTAGQAVVSAFGMKHEGSDHNVKGPKQVPLLGPEFVRFCVVRNPVKRFISAYRYSVHMIAKRPDLIERQFIVEHGLQHDVNDFIAKLEETDFDIRSRLHFKPQVFFTRRTKPQIMLRFENLSTDIEIVRKLVPDMWTGLKPVNTSDGRKASDAVNTELTSNSIEFLKKLYRDDFRVFGYRAKA